MTPVLAGEKWKLYSMCSRAEFHAVLVMIVSAGAAIFVLEYFRVALARHGTQGTVCPGAARHGLNWHALARHGTARFELARFGSARHGTV